jgi:phosphoenolpyruvate-protein kinase (PTS system EI component)
MQDRRQRQPSDAPPVIPMAATPVLDGTTIDSSTSIAGVSIGARVILDGLGFGTVHYIPAADTSIFHDKSLVPSAPIEAAQVDNEISRFSLACRQVAQKFSEMKGSDIYPVLATIAVDPSILDQVKSEIRKLKSAETAFAEVASNLLPIFRGIYGEKADEVAGVFSELLQALDTATTKPSSMPDGELILVATTILPTMLTPDVLLRTKGIVAHTISPHARSILSGENIPAVIVQGDLAAITVPGAKLLVDAARDNCILVNPNDAQLEQYRNALATAAISRMALPLNDPRPRTLDGVEIQLAANLDGVAGIERAKRVGLTSVGLVRTELIHREPDLQNKLKNISPQSSAWINAVEDYHFQAYTSILAAFPKGTVTIRTFDDSADKAGSTNPDWLANRGIRQSLKEKEAEFRAQARAIIRAAELHSNVQVLFPMVNDKMEFTAGKRIFFEETSALLERDSSHPLAPISQRPNLKFGAMVETPAAMFMVRSLVTGPTRADFLSIGTNDLIRYVLATDGQDHIVGHDNHMYHPAVLRALDYIVKEARKADPSISISVCGDAAGRPFLTNIFVGLGIDTLSIRPAQASGISTSVQTASASAAGRAFESMLREESHPAVYDRMQQLLSDYLQ